METPVMEPYSTAEVLGGMMGAMVEEAAVTAAEKVLVVSIFLHGIHLHLSDTGDVGYGRAGHAGHDHAGQDIHMGQTAPEMLHMVPASGRF